VDGAWRSDGLARVVARLEAELDAAWTSLLTGSGVEPGSSDEEALAWLVIVDPAHHDWRVVDAALDRLTCPACGCRIARGPADCDRCAYHHGVRFGARETDRPGVPAGNEHAVRVAFAVARFRDRYQPRARVGYELVLPALVAGDLPTTRQAQAAKALIDRLTPEECDRVTSFAEVERLARGRPSPHSRR
jgi:hypothetical protein